MNERLPDRPKPPEERRRSVLVGPEHRVVPVVIPNYVAPNEKLGIKEWCPGWGWQLLSCKTETVIDQNVAQLDWQQRFKCPDCGGEVIF